MSVTKVNRKSLQTLLRHDNGSKIRMAISRGNLIENKNKQIDLKNEANRKWLESQIAIARDKGLVIDIDLEETKPNMELDEKRNSLTATVRSGSSVDIELKKARTKLIHEQTKTAQLSREIALGNYLRTADIIDAVKVYLDQTLNIANTNILNVATHFCKANNIRSAEIIVSHKSELTEALNQAIEDGRVEVMNHLERMVTDQIEKLAKK